MWNISLETIAEKVTAFRVFHAAHPLCSEPKQSLSKLRGLQLPGDIFSHVLSFCLHCKLSKPRTKTVLAMYLQQKSLSSDCASVSLCKETSLARYCFRLSHSVVYRSCRCINLPDVLALPVYQSAKCSGAAGVSICQMFWLNAGQRGCCVYSQEFGGDLR